MVLRLNALFIIYILPENTDLIATTKLLFFFWGGGEGGEGGLYMLYDQTAII